MYFFNGVAQHHPSHGGARGSLHLLESHYFTFVVGLGNVSNNIVEFHALHLNISMDVHRQIHHIQIMGDSKLVIDCFKKQSIPINRRLSPIFDTIVRMLDTFDHVSF